MLVRSMVGDEIQNDAKASRVGLRDQSVEIRKIAEDRRNVAIIRNVISEIRHRRRVNRRNPNRIDAETHNMVEALNDSRKIPDSISVGILKRPRINLIDDATLPPLQIFHSHEPLKSLVQINMAQGKIDVQAVSRIASEGFLLVPRPRSMTNL